MSSTALLESAISVLRSNADRWIALSTDRKIAMLERARARLGENIQRWIAAAAERRQFAPDSEQAGGEHLTGPFALANGINGYIQTLKALTRESPLPVRVTQGSDGVTRVRVVPHSLPSAIIAQGITGTVWLEPGVAASSARMGKPAYDGSSPGRVALVLGAGNIDSIPPLDVLHKLIDDGQVVLLKTNPVNEFIAPIMEDIFREFVDEGFLHVATGGADVGAWLTRHASIDTIHVTGSERTYNAIAFGDGSDADERRRQNDPLLGKPITAELGGVNPVVVVPGSWSSADIRYQARHIVSSKVVNVGFNCVASQILIVPDDWSGTPQLLDEMRATLDGLEPRHVWYPGGEERRDEAVRGRDNVETFLGKTRLSLIDGLSPDETGDPLFHHEVFAPVLGIVRVKSADIETYTRRAVAFCNEVLRGTLGATVLMHPKTIKEHPQLYRMMLTELRYGIIGINVWNAAGYPLTECTWGAFPGHDPSDIQSGVGHVHNTWMIRDARKTVLEGTFTPFARSVGAGAPTIWPSYPWFVRSGKVNAIGRAAAGYATDPRIGTLGKVVRVVLG